MQQIFDFLIRNKNFLLFSVLFVVAFLLTIQSHSYHNAKFVNSANFLSGGIYSAKNSITDYFDLKTQNQILVDENMRLRKDIERFKKETGSTSRDSALFKPQYHYIDANIINNTYSKTMNLLTLKGGRSKGIAIDMGVVTSNGIIGIVDVVSKNYATVQSILNTNSEINAKLKNSDHFGTLVWNTKDPNVVQLTEIPRLAALVVGDTVTTGGKSTIFPKGILIGTIKDFELLPDDSFVVDIALFNDMTSLNHVYVIENKDSEEILELEKEGADAEQ